MLRPCCRHFRPSANVKLSGLIRKKHESHEIYGGSSEFPALPADRE
jgi:hypothetical protein